MRLDALRRDASACESCDLYRDATQTVFGAGRADAQLMLVGEQPGDREDIAGAPFVGPAGGVLERALRTAGIDTVDVYMTNAVKHFKFTRSGKRRIHQKPNRDETTACKRWLAAEVDTVRPIVIVALGATAAQSMLGSAFKVTERRGEPMPGPGDSTVVATVHPSSILRVPDADARAAAFEGLVADLRIARDALRSILRRAAQSRAG